MSLILLIAWQAYIQNEQEIIDSLAELLIHRADIALIQATDALKNLSELRIAPCSQRHVAQMQKILFQTVPIDKAVYFENGQIKCSSHGETYPFESRLSQHQTDFVTPDGVVVTANAFPGFSEKTPAMFLKYRSYGVFINASRFVDAVVKKDVSLLLATLDGTVVAINEPLMDSFLHQLIQNRNGVQGSQNLYSVESKGVWIAAATKPKGSVLQYLRHQHKTILPITLSIGIFIFILMLSLLLRRPSLKWELRQAIRKKEFHVYYQPIIDSRTGRCCCAEALLRWQRSDGSMIRPDIFIPLAEESGLIKPLTDHLIETIAMEMRETLAANCELHIAINLSADDIKTGRVFSVITNVLVKAGIKPEQIWLEVTERGILDIDSAYLFLAEARKQGHVVAIDDFGTGYSSLQYLQDLPIDVLKIDKAFVDSIGIGAASSNVVSHIIDMAKSLKLILVAEGVEIQSQADYLAAHGVEFMQGWLYYKALPAKEFLNTIVAMDHGLRIKSQTRT